MPQQAEPSRFFYLARHTACAIARLQCSQGMCTTSHDERSGSELTAVGSCSSPGLLQAKQISGRATISTQQAAGSIAMQPATELLGTLA